MGDASSPSAHGSLSPQNALRLAENHLKNARMTTDLELATLYLNESRAALSRMEDPKLDTLLSPDFGQDSSLLKDVISVLSELGMMPPGSRQLEMTQGVYEDAEDLSISEANGSQTPLLDGTAPYTLVTAIPLHIFAENKRPPAIDFKLPECGEDITGTPQLAYCLGLLQTWRSFPATILDPAARRWLRTIDKNADEIDRLVALATDVITTFVRDSIKDVHHSAEALRLVPVLDKNVYRYLLEELYNDIERSPELESPQLECLAQVIQGASAGYLEAADLVRILEHINGRQHYLRQQSKDRIYELSFAVSSVVDAMADTNVNGLDREWIHRSMSDYVDGLKATADPYFVYQAAYTYQALHHVPETETIWHAVLQRNQKLYKLVDYVKAIDVKHVLQQLQKGYEDPDGNSNEESQDMNTKALLDHLKEGGSFVSKESCIKQAADKSLQQLGVRYGSTEESTGQAAEGIGHRDYRLSAVFPSHATPSLLGGVQTIPGIESRLRRLRLRKLQLAEKQNAVYVKLRAKAPSEPFNILRFSLMGHVKEFLKGDRKVFLLLGAPGSGKSTFSRVLERDLWESYERMESPIPLYIDMSVIEEPTVDPISKCLRSLGFTESQIKELKIHRKFILICDEYDQILQTDKPYNVYTSNKMNQPDGWNGKLMISCRSEYLGSYSLDNFQPAGQNSQMQPDLFQQVTIEPFSMGQVQDYIKQYVLRHEVPWQVDDYLGVFKRDNCLQELSANPLLLSLALEELPRLVGSQEELSVKRFNKVAIYDQIVTYWFERRKALFEEAATVDDASERLTCDNFVQRGINYLKRLAATIYKNQDGNPVVESSHLNSHPSDDGVWKRDLFSQSGSIKILREASPLKCSGTKFQFIHPSILEYGLTLSMYDPHNVRRATAPRPVLSRRASTDSSMSFESDISDVETATSSDQGTDSDSPLMWRNLVNDHSVLRFLEDRVRLEPLFKQKLMVFVELSKTEVKARKAATNAITILVGAGVSFNGKDLQGIQVPGANLSHGMFESAQLQKADLRKASLCGAWLHKTNFSQAKMKGARFGELPYLSEDHSVYCCEYSPDGKYFAVGLSKGGIKLYTTSGWEQIKALSGHTDVVYNIAISSNGLMISGSNDKTAKLWDIESGNCIKTLVYTDIVYDVDFSPQSDKVVTGGGGTNALRLWDVNSGECQHIMGGHTAPICSVAYSPNGRQVASASIDKTVQLWDVETGTLQYTLSGHEGIVYCATYSPQGQLIASGSADKSIRLWDVMSGTCQSILHGHSGLIRSVAFSPKGTQIASGSFDRSLRLWDVETGASQNVWSVHNGEVMSVVFSPDGNQIASGCYDSSVRLWNVGTGYSQHNGAYHVGSIATVAASSSRDLIATGGDDGILRLWDTKSEVCIQALSGHDSFISGIAFSPAGDRVVSGCFGKTVRLWDVSTGACRHVLRGHSDKVRSVAFSPSGSLVASGSDDKTLRLWDAQSGHCNRTICGHDELIRSVAFSPAGDRIASGSHDWTVRLWNVETGEWIRTFNGHNNFVMSVVFSPTGNMIASGSCDNTIRLWDTNAGSCRQVLIDHDSPIRGVVFSPNGDQVASGSEDKSVRVWSVASGQSLAVIDRFQGPVKCLAWCAKSDREYLITGEENGVLQFCEVRRLAEGGYDVRQCWMSPRALDAADAAVRGVQGLADWDKRLLKQRGAVDVPDPGYVQV
ncbi:hypothetical protein BGX31_009977 [Mortierella sp. GBA43]|nr:hypothetical protein BGX31_009977 [Mortierella sp. GBA43]